MCFQPLKLRNPTKSYKRGYDKVEISVPCGHCPSCIVNYQDEWFARTRAEYQLYISAGGYVLFPTLTYNNAHLPRYTYKEFSFPCFSVLDRQRWLKRMRKAFESKFGYSWKNLDSDGKPILSVKALTTCEFGEKYQRPHYHALTFFPPMCETKFFRKNGRQYALTSVLRFASSAKRRNYLSHLDNSNIAAYCLKKGNGKTDNFYLLLSELDKPAYPATTSPRNLVKLVERSWRFVERKALNTDPSVKSKTIKVLEEIGFVGWSRKGGPFVKSLRAIRYVQKYMTKDTFYMNNDDVRQFLDYLHNLKNSPSDEDRREYEEVIKDVRPFLPKHLQGINFGASLVNELTGASDDNLIQILDKGLKFFENDKVSTCYIPRYVLNRACYDYGRTDGKKDPKKRFLTDFGALVQGLKNKLSVRRRTQVLEHNVSYLWLNDHITPSVKNMLETEFNGVPSNPLELKDYIYTLMNGATFTDLARYSLYFRGYSIPHRMLPFSVYNSYVKLLDDAEIFGSFRINRRRDIVPRHLDSNGIEKDAILSRNSIYLRERDNMFNNVSYFANFDKILDIIDNISSYYRYSEGLQSLCEQRRSSRLNQITHPLPI